MKKTKDLRQEPVSSTKFDDSADLPRNAQLVDKEELQETLVKLYNEVEAGFDAQGQRSDAIADYWNCYNTRLDHNQFYYGTSRIYVPIVYDAVNARVTRFSNQIFPQNGRYVDVASEDGANPDAIMALLEHYIRKTKLQTDLIPALLRSGDIEGQYSVYVDWDIYERSVASKEERAPLLEASPVIDPTKTVYEVTEKVYKEGLPAVEIISDCDLLVLPASANTIAEALKVGGSVTVIRRWSKAKLQQMIADGEVDKEAGKALLKEMNQPKKFGRKNTDKSMVDAAGIKDEGSGIKTVLVYETWSMLVFKKKKRLYKMYFAGVDKCLSCKRNPYWSDKMPIISAPVEKVKGSFKGKSKVEAVCTFQYAANDAVNMGMDSAAYALMPIVLTDPEKNPRIGSLILSMAAIWETSPKDTQFAKFPEIWKDAFEIVANARNQIFQTLSVNPAQITQQANSKRRPNQADIANEQQIDILTTANAVTTIEGGVLTPILHFMLELDHQFRDKQMTIMQHGKMGVKASMQTVPIIELNKKHYIKWFGVEAARNAQQIQQQIAAMNVIRGIPPQMYPGHRLNMVPAITLLMENAFGPRLAPLIFEDMTNQVTVPPELENELLSQGMEWQPSQFDNVQQHMQAHMKAVQQTGDPHGTIRAHIQAHQIMAMMLMQEQQPGGQPGAPGGAGPGLPGQPRPGAQPRNPRAQGPAGMIPQDQMKDPQRMPQ